MANSKSLSFDSLPEAVQLLDTRLQHIEQLLTNHAPATTLKRPVSTKELCEFLDLTEATIIRYRKKGLIPFFTIGSAVRFDLDKVISALEKKNRK